jgi:endoglucanase
VATDTPGLEGGDIIPIALGKGPTIDVYEQNFIPDPALIELTLKTAQEEEIPVQINVVASGGTDAYKINLLGEGVPCMVIGVPTRYVHTMAGIIDANDLDMAVRLLAAVVAKLDAPTVKTLGHL